MNAGSLTFEDCAEFVARDIPPPEWIVDNLIYKGAKGDLVAKAKQHKTFFMLQMAASIAAGRDFLGLRVVRPFRVAYFDMELEKWDVQDRLKNIQTAFDLQFGRGMLHLVFMRNMEAEALRNDAKGLAAQLARLKIELAVFDPRYRLLLKGEEENKSEGLRAIHAWRSELCKVCAVMLVIHDPKSDTAGRSATERGAGSYTAGADFDFRFVLSPHKNGGALSVLEFVGRARKEPPPITLMFDGERGVFDARPDIPPETAQPITAGRQPKTDEQRAKENAERADAFEKAALEIANRPGELLGKTAFLAELARTKAGAIDGAKRWDSLKALIERGVLAQTNELERKPKGHIGGKKNGRLFIGTPERIKAYVDSFATLPL